MPHADCSRAGLVYVVEQADSKNVIKVGMTRRTMPERLRELQRSYGGVWLIRAALSFNDARAVERVAHAYLERQGYFRRKEFFKCPPDVPIKLLERLNAKGA